MTPTLLVTCDPEKKLWFHAVDKLALARDEPIKCNSVPRQLLSSGELLAIACANGEVKLLSLREFKKTGSLMPSKEVAGCSAVDFGQTENQILAGYDNGKVVQWDIKSCTASRSLKLAGCPISQISRVSNRYAVCLIAQTNKFFKIDILSLKVASGVADIELFQ